MTLYCIGGRPLLWRNSAVREEEQEEEGSRESVNAEEFPSLQPFPSQLSGNNAESFT